MHFVPLRRFRTSVGRPCEVKTPQNNGQIMKYLPKLVRIMFTCTSLVDSQQT